MRKISLFLIVVMILWSLIPTGEVKAVSSLSGQQNTLSQEKVTGYLMTDKMPIKVFPVSFDFFYQYFHKVSGKVLPAEVRSYELSGVEIGYKDLFLVPDPDNPGGWARYTILYHTTGSRLLAVGVYDRGMINEAGKYVPYKAYYSADVRTDPANPDTEHSVLGDYYPNKIINDLEAATRIARYQEINGPFVAGKEYSMHEVLGLKDREGYVLGKTSDGSIVNAGGICVTVTNWNKMLTLIGAQKTVHWQHPSEQKYFENPFGGELLSVGITDATVDQTHDFRWIQPVTGWVKVTVAVMTDGDKVKSEFGDKETPYDALEIITFRFTTNKPDLASQKIQDWKKAYVSYRESGLAGTNPLTAEGNRMTARVSWQRNDMYSLLINLIAPEERVGRYSQELTTDPFLKSLVVLKTEANGVDPNSDTLMGSYLKTTSWYPNELSLLRMSSERLLKFNSTLSHLDYISNRIPGQKIQCVGLVILVAGMDDRFYNIGGFENLESASQLIPTEIKSGQRSEMWIDGYHVLAINSIEEVNVGDLFVTYYTKVGHVGAVIGKKIVDGETVLLLITANQVGDGRIRIFEVDSGNFEVAFGFPAYRKVVVRK